MYRCVQTIYIKMFKKKLRILGFFSTNNFKLFEIVGNIVKYFRMHMHSEPWPRGGTPRVRARALSPPPSTPLLSTSSGVPFSTGFL